MLIVLKAASHTFRLLFLVLILSMTISSSGQASLSAPAPMNAANLRHELQVRGLGSGVKVTKVDGTVMRGTLVELEADSFEVVPANAVYPTYIPDTQVAGLDNAGLTRRAKEAIAVFVGTVLLGLVVIAAAPFLKQTDALQDSLSLRKSDRNFFF